MIAAAGEALPEPVTVKGGKKKKVTVAYGESLTVSVPRNREEDIAIQNEITEPVQAPLALGMKLAGPWSCWTGWNLGACRS